MFSYTGVNSVVCLALRTIFITDVVVPGDGCKTENPLLFKIVPKFISKHKPLMLWHKLNSKRVPGALSLVCPMAGSGVIQQSITCHMLCNTLALGMS